MGQTVACWQILFDFVRYHRVTQFQLRGEGRRTVLHGEASPSLIDIVTVLCGINGLKLTMDVDQTIALQSNLHAVSQGTTQQLLHFLLHLESPYNSTPATPVNNDGKHTVQLHCLILCNMLWPPGTFIHF